MADNVVFGQDQLRHADNWKGTYRGIPFEICAWGEMVHSKRPIFNFYVYLREDRVGEGVWQQLWLEPPYATYETIVGEFYWNYGCTFYAKLTALVKYDSKEEIGAIKIGCDYNHLWDDEQGGCYNETYVAHDARRCIDSIHDLLPGGYKVWCFKCGKLAPESEMVYEDGYKDKCQCKECVARAEGTQPSE